jgi:uncharacterized Tic20 family protein
MNPPMPASAQRKRLGLFERYLSVWVGLCMVFGVLLGRFAPQLVQSLRSLEFGTGSHINLPIALLIWLMIIPMMMKVDFASIRRVGDSPKGLVVTLVVNWLVKPFSMALLAWFFFRVVFASWMNAAEADQYIAGCIILAAAPCTAMVFVWSYLTDGDQQDMPRFAHNVLGLKGKDQDEGGEQRENGDRAKSWQEAVLKPRASKTLDQNVSKDGPYGQRNHDEREHGIKQDGVGNLQG